MNRYVVTRGEERSLVLYWYQSRDRVVASEYRANFFSIADAIRSNRTDTALVRVVVPIHDDNRDQAVAAAADFVRGLLRAASSLFGLRESGWIQLKPARGSYPPAPSA